MAAKRPAVPAEDWCHTEVEEEPDIAYRFLWTIERFPRILESWDQGKSLESKEFYVRVRGRDTVWKLVLTPVGKEHQGFVSLMLHYLGPADGKDPAEPVKATVELSLLDAVGVKENKRQCEYEFLQKKYTGFTKFASHNSLLSGSLLTSNSILTIHCQVLIKGQLQVKTTAHAPRLLDLEPDTFGNQMLEMLEHAADIGPDQITLVLKDGWLTCHTFPLVARSQVFRAMFNHDMRERNENKVDIHDLDVECGRSLLHYIYTGRVQAGSNHRDLLFAAEKYNLQELKEYCESVLSEEIQLETCLELLLLADAQLANKLKAAVQRFILRHRMEFLSIPGWNICLESRPALFSEIFKAVVSCSSTT